MIVIDATTSLTNVNRTDEKTEGCWLSKKAISFLSSCFTDKNISIPEALHLASDLLKKQLNSAENSHADLAYPSASIMIARDLNDKIELFSIGDCTALIKLSGHAGERVIHDDSVTKLDNSILDLLAEKHKTTGISVDELLPSVKDLLIANRKKMNRKDGYWIFDPTGEAIQNGTHLLFPKKAVESIALMSDGFYCITSINPDYDSKNLTKALETTPADELIDYIFHEYENDAHLNKFPRFKLKDDASVVFAKIKI